MFYQEQINKIKDCLTEQQQTIAVAESVTSGLLQAAFSTGDKASEYFQGGLTAYNIGQKCRHLRVNPVHAMECNCVSQKMATDMAVSIANMFTSEWAVAITGYATTVPESNNKLFAYFSIVHNGQEVAAQKIEAEAGMEEGLPIQLLYVNTILDKLAGVLEEYK